MGSRKRLKKRQIREDQLVTTTLRVSQFIQDHFTQVISGVIILVAAIGVILFTANVRRNAAAEAEAEFAIAMNAYKYTDRSAAAASFRGVTDRYGSHQGGIVALYFLGECYLSQFLYDAAIIAFERLKRLSRDRQAVGSKVVGAVAEGVDEADEDVGLFGAELGEERRAAV